MNIWLDRNSQCPTCRVDITPQSPIKPVLGEQVLILSYLQMSFVWRSFKNIYICLGSSSLTCVSYVETRFIQNKHNLRWYFG